MRWLLFFRFWLAAIMLLGAAGPLGRDAMAQSSATPAATTIDRPLDLAWTVPQPTDLPQPGYGALRSGYLRLSAYYPHWRAPADDPAALSRAAGAWRQTYDGWLGLPNEDDPDNYDRIVRTDVTRYRTDADARSGYAAVVAGFEAIGYTVDRTTPDVADAAISLRATKTDSNTKRVYKSLTLVFRSGSMVVELQIRDYTNDAPALSSAMLLANLVVQRIGGAVGGISPNLSLAVPRPSDDGVTFDGDRYLRRGGTQNPATTTSAASSHSADAFNREHAIIDRYWYRANLTDPTHPDGVPTAYIATVFRFPDAASATRFFAEEPARWRDGLGSDVHDVGQVESDVPAGDEATMVAYRIDRPAGAAAAGFQGWTRVGDRVTTIAASASPAISHEAMVRLLQTAAGCLRTPCGDPVAFNDLLRAPAARAAAAASPASSDGATPAASAPSAPIDLAWVATLPSDLTQRGYGLTGARQRDADAYAIAIGGADPAALARRLETDGWRQGYASTVALPGADDPDIFDRVVFSTVSRYDDPVGASAALAAVRSQLIDAGHDPAPFTDSLGDDAAFLRRQFTSPDNGRRAEAARLLVRDRDVVIDLTVLDWTNDAPATSETVGLARKLLARLNEARTGGSPNLALGVSRIDGATVIPRLDSYLRRSNTSIPTYRESENELDADDAFMEKSGATDDVRYRVDWSSDPTRPDQATGGYFVKVRRYDNVFHAMVAFLTEPPQQMTDLPTDAQSIDLPRVGDGSTAITFTTDRAGQPTRGYIGWIRIGDRVAEVDLWGPGIDQAAFEQLARLQAACMQANDCWAPTAAPAFDAAPPGNATPVPGMF